MLFDTDAGVTDSIDLGDCRTSIRTRGTAASFYVPMWPNPENRDKWTFSCWLKRSVLGVATSVFGAGETTYNVSDIGFNASNQLIFSNDSGYWSFITNRVFIDTSAWMYLQVNYDSAQAVSTERIKFYINGVRELDFATATYPTISRASTINRVDMPHQIGLNGELYLANVCFIDGQNLEPSAFGYKSTVYNEWRANTRAELAALCSSYGVSSFFLDFKDGSTSAALGNDASTHNNDWTVTGYVLSGATTNWYQEGPGNPYPTLGTSDPATTSKLSLGNLRYTGLASQNQQRRTQKAIRGKVYFEVTRVSGTHGAYISLANSNPSSAPGSTIGSYGWLISEGFILYNAEAVSARSLSTVVGDVLMFAVDLGNAKVWQGVNGVWYGDYVPPSATGAVSLSDLPNYEDWFLGVGSSDACVLDCNFGQRPFAYSPPPGFLSQCNLNDASPRVTNPSLHFDVLTGTGAEIKSLADARYAGNCIELIKDRGNAANWQFVDVARGLSAASPFPSGSLAETSYVTPTGASVAYVFNTASAPAINNLGTVTTKPTVSSNIEAGISAIAYYTENYKTLGHGLNVAPKLIIAKMRTAATSQGWSMWGPGITGKSLNTLTASATEASWGVEPTLLTLSSGNCDSNYYSSYSTGIAYCFAQTSGFSKMGFAYAGNASVDGPFVYLGFKPKLVIIKHRTATSGHWVFVDSVRSPGNYVNDALYTDAAGAEVVTTNTTGAYIQFLSTGFKVCSSHVDVNAFGVRYDVIAFADVGETYALAR